MGPVGTVVTETQPRSQTRSKLYIITLIGSDRVLLNCLGSQVCVSMCLMLKWIWKDLCVLSTSSDQVVSYYHCRRKSLRKLEAHVKMNAIK